MAEIHPIVVPKWGLEMIEGRLLAWLIEEGKTVQKGDELIEIETTKVTNTVESPHAGVLRRKLGQLNEVYACGTLIGVIADGTATAEELDRFISGYTVVPKDKVAEPSGPAYQTIGVAGISLRFVRQGNNGIPIILIHGFAGDLNNWLLVQPVLAARRSTYSIDLPGHGGSSKDLSGIGSFEDVATVLLAFLDIEKIDKVHLVAHSMGAPIALAMARRADRRIETLCLIAPAGLGSSVHEGFIQGLLKARNRRQLSEVLQSLFFNQDLVTRELAEDILKFKRLDGVDAALQRCAVLLRGETRTQDGALHGIRQPVRILWGTDDRVISPISADILPDNVDLMLLPNTGHMPHTEKSATVAAAILSLIERPR